jgi:hypothetical protein
MIAVFDIDGVLADATHRPHHVARRPKDWDAFFSTVGEDPVLEHGRQRLLHLAETYDIVLLSGRPERCRADTVDWLDRNGMTASRLVLRPDDDHRPAATLKAELVRLVGGPDDIAVIVDDDELVIDRLRGLGYRVEHFRG